MPEHLSWLDIALLPFAFFLSAALVWAAKSAFHSRGFQDHANSRSLHSGSTPKIGGLAILPAVMAALALQMLFRESAFLFRPDACCTPQILLWIATSFLVFAICVLNDRTATELPALLRLTGFLVSALVLVGGLFAIRYWTANQTIAAILSTAGLTGNSLWLFFFAVLSVVAFTNFFNFMDGLDGLAGSMGVIGFSCLGLIGYFSPVTHGQHLVWAAGCTAMASMGFLVWNWPKAKVFMGDTGSTFLGFSAMGLGWAGALNDVWHWSLPFLVFFSFWFDAGLTLVRRALRGEKVWRPHREHFYQRAVLSMTGPDMPERHLRVLRPAILLMLVSALVATAQHLHGLGFREGIPWSALLLLSVVHGLVALFVERQFRKSSSMTAQE